MRDRTQSGKGGGKAAKQPAAGRGSPPTSLLLYFGASLLLSLVLFGASLPHDWISDDAQLVRENQTLQRTGFDTAVRIWTIDYWEQIGTDGRAYPLGADRNLYRPVTILSLWLNARLGAATPAGFRFMNLLLHALAAALVGTLASRRFGAMAAWAALTVMAIHPVSLDVVNRIIGRSDILVVVGASAALLVQAGAGGALTPGRVAVFLLAAVVAFGSKESGFLLVPVSAVMAWLDRRDRARPWIWPLLALGAALLFLTARTAVVGWPRYVPDPRADLLGNPVAGLGFGARLPAALANVAWYVRMSLLPWPMRAIEWPEHLPTFTTPETIIGAILLVILAGAAVLAIHRSRGAALPLAWWLAVWGIIGQFLAPIGAWRESRLVYPMVGAVALGAALVTARAPRPKFSRSALALLGISWIVIIAIRTPAYRNDLTLLEADLTQQPSAITHLMLGSVYHDQGRMEEARREKEAALVVAPNSSQALADAGGFYVELGNAPRADSLLTRAIALEPRNGSALVNLGNLRFRQGRVSESHELLLKAEATDPTFIITQMNLAVVEIRMGDFTAARRRIEVVERQDPGNSAVRDLMRTLEAAEAGRR